MDTNSNENTGDTEVSGEDILIVVSKLKNYIRKSSDMNTSGNVAPTLSLVLRKMCDQAIQNAKNDGRKTVMERDFTTAGI